MSLEKKKRNDRILLIGFLCLAILSGIVLYAYQKLTTYNACVVVKVKGQEVGRYSLNQNQRIPIGDETGDYNLLIIKDGYAKMEKASCKDLICVKHRRISKNGETIVCLPHQVVIEIESQEEDAIDGATN